MVWRYAGAAGGAVLGYIHGHPRGALHGAVHGARKGYRLGLARENLPKQMKTNGKRKRVDNIAKYSKRAKKVTVGMRRKAGAKRLSAWTTSAIKRRGRGGRTNRKKMKGRSSYGFSKGKKIKNSMASRCLSKGFMKTINTYGIAKDGNSLYIHHSTGHVNETARTISYAILRSLFRKAGLSITNKYNAIEVSNPVAGAGPTLDSTGFQIVYESVNPVTAVITHQVYLTAANQSFDDVVTGFVLMNNGIIDYLRDSTKNEPNKVSIFTQDNTSVTVYWRIAAEIQLLDCQLEVDFHSELTCQNRTGAALNATGNPELTERVDIQPLQGWIYDFKHADMRVRDQGRGSNNNTFFNRINDSGLTFVGGADYLGAIEPLEPKYFANVSKAVRVTLQPGEVKKTYFDYRFSGKFTNIIRKMRVAQWISATGLLDGLAGRSQMICFEEMLKTNSANQIAVAYERELKVGAILTERKSKPALLETLVVATETNYP